MSTTSPHNLFTNNRMIPVLPAQSVLVEAIDKINVMAKNICQLLQKNETDKAIDGLLKLFNCVEALINFQIEITGPIENKDFFKTKGPKPFHDLYKNLLSLMKGLQMSIAKDDYITARELIEFEFDYNLTQWKISILSHIHQ